jgi:hypothetical protein
LISLKQNIVSIPDGLSSAGGIVLPHAFVIAIILEGVAISARQQDFGKPIFEIPAVGSPGSGWRGFGGLVSICVITVRRPSRAVLVR